jgi:hypothetical protein
MGLPNCHYYRGEFEEKTSFVGTLLHLSGLLVINNNPPDDSAGNVCPKDKKVM